MVLLTYHDFFEEYTFLFQVRIVSDTCTVLLFARSYQIYTYIFYCYLLSLSLYNELFQFNSIDCREVCGDNEQSSTTSSFCPQVLYWAGGTVEEELLNGGKYPTSINFWPACYTIYDWQMRCMWIHINTFCIVSIAVSGDEVQSQSTKRLYLPKASTCCNHATALI